MQPIPQLSSTKLTWARTITLVFHPNHLQLAITAACAWMAGLLPLLAILGWSYVMPLAYYFLRFARPQGGLVFDIPRQSRNELFIVNILGLGFALGTWLLISPPPLHGKYESADDLKNLIAFILTALAISFIMLVNLLCWAINAYRKLSLHLASLTATLTAAVYLVLVGELEWEHALPYVAACTLGLPLVAWARHSLGAHTRGELLLGMLAGNLGAAVFCVIHYITQEMG